MNAPVLAETVVAAPAPHTTSNWATSERRRIALSLALGMLLLGALFHNEVAAAVQTWNASTAYNHCFLIIPITLYLLWDRRFDLAGIHARPVPPALLLGLPLTVAWLLAERLGIMEGRQLVAISFVELLFLAILGKRLWWAMAGPLLYLYFLVPFGEFLTPSLQDITTWFIRQGVDILGIPAYIDGYTIEIPQGTFFVAEACAGLRFLIASVAFGCLYAIMMYRSPMRRGIFILVSIVVPIIANGLRGLGIVSLGYILGSAQAAAADHIIYGWLFFSIVMVALIAMGLPFRQDDISTQASYPTHEPIAPPSRRRGMPAIAAGTALVAAITPMVAAGLTMAAANPPPVPAAIDPGPGCTAQVSTQDPAASRVRTQSVVCGGVAMDISWETFSPRITAAPLMAERRRLVQRAVTEGLSENWLERPEGIQSAWRILRSNDPVFVTAVSVWIDGKPIRPSLKMRVRMAITSLLGSSHAPLVVTVTPHVTWATLNGSASKSADASLDAFLLSHPDLDRTFATMSAM